MDSTKYEGHRRFSVAHLLAALSEMFIVLPLANRVAYGSVVESALFTLVLLTAVSAVGGRRSTLISSSLLAAPCLITRWLSHVWSASVLVDLSLAAAISVSSLRTT